MSSLSPPRALFVIRRSTGGPQAGDQVHVRQMLRWLQPRLDLRVVELEPVGRPGRIANLFKGWPVEMTGVSDRANRQTLRTAMDEHRPEYVYLIHEALFPFADEITDAHVILFCMNAISCLADTDPSLLVRLTAPLARAFENRYFRPGPGRTLVLVSRSDARWLRSRFQMDDRFPIAAPGALRPAILADNASVRREILITGSYDWWRKRRDLKQFASVGSNLPMLVNDARAAAIIGARAQRIELKTTDFTTALRFGLVTDRFLGGFKLKSLEYVANNAVVLSRSDIRADYEGLPDADLFVRYTPGISDIHQAVESIGALPADETIARFRRFQAACTERFDWDRCLKPLSPPFTPNPSLDDPSV